MSDQKSTRSKSGFSLPHIGGLKLPFFSHSSDRAAEGATAVAAADEETRRNTEEILSKIGFEFPSETAEAAAATAAVIPPDEAPAQVPQAAPPVGGMEDATAVEHETSDKADSKSPQKGALRPLMSHVTTLIQRLHVPRKSPVTAEVENEVKEAIVTTDDDATLNQLIENITVAKPATKSLGLKITALPKPILALIAVGVLLVGGGLGFFFTRPAKHSVPVAMAVQNKMPQNRVSQASASPMPTTQNVAEQETKESANTTANTAEEADSSNETTKNPTPQDRAIDTAVAQKNIPQHRNHQADLVKKVVVQSTIGENEVHKAIFTGEKVSAKSHQHFVTDGQALHPSQVVGLKEGDDTIVESSSAEAKTVKGLQSQVAHLCGLHVKKVLHWKYYQGYLFCYMDTGSQEMSTLLQRSSDGSFTLIGGATGLMTPEQLSSLFFVDVGTATKLLSKH